MINKISTKINLNEVDGFGELAQFHSKKSIALFENDDLFKEYFNRQINLKIEFKHRESLLEVVAEQYKNFEITETTKLNIDKLKNNNSFTITSGHQLVIGGGPMYVAYKILSTVALCIKAKKILPNYDFIPVFWLATEDHDKAEISEFEFHSNKINWNNAFKGAVGEFPTTGIVEIVNDIKTKNPGFFELFVQAYSLNKLCDAHRYLINKLFGNYGIIIIDGNSINLKNLFKPIIKQEIHHFITEKNVHQTNEKLRILGFNSRIEPRKINLFLLQNGERKRLEVDENNIFTIDKSFELNVKEIDNFIDENPQKFSPNVLLRPIYQELILPNIAFVGGPAEVEYWLQLSDLFKAVNVAEPIIILRFSAILIKEKSINFLNAEELPLNKLLLNEAEIAKEYAIKHSGDELNFKNEISEIQKQFEILKIKTEKTDKSLIPSLLAESKRLTNSLEIILSKLIKSKKLKHENTIKKLLKIRAEILPENVLQERKKHLCDYSIKQLHEIFSQILNEGNFNEVNIFIDKSQNH